MTNRPWLSMTLEEGVGEVLNILTGYDLHYVAELDRFRSITHHLNRALRYVALEREWSYYSSLLNLGHPTAHSRTVQLPLSVRPRVISDDAVRLVNKFGRPIVWAYILPRESIHKYQDRPGLWCSTTNSTLMFSRPFTHEEAKLHIEVPVMREPRLLEIPRTLESVEDFTTPPPPVPPGTEVLQVRNFHDPGVVEEWAFEPGLPPYNISDPESSLQAAGLTDEEVRHQLIDAPYPDLIVLKAASLYAQSDPVSQPRVQFLDSAYTSMMFQIAERDERSTDSPYMNEFNVPISNTIHSTHGGWGRNHPHSDERW